MQLFNKISFNHYHRASENQNIINNSPLNDRNNNPPSTFLLKKNITSNVLLSSNLAKGRSPVSHSTEGQPSKDGNSRPSPSTQRIIAREQRVNSRKLAARVIISRNPESARAVTGLPPKTRGHCPLPSALF